MGDLSLGIELSTQSAKAVLLDIESGAVVHTVSFNYDSKFPGYGTSGGVLPSKEPAVRHTSPRMLMEALDALFAGLARDGVDAGRIRAIKADGMQHCTVYCGSGLSKALAGLGTGRSLNEQLGPHITRKTSPIWEDRSTEREAEALERLLRKKGGAARLTGNRVELRFPGAQVMKWAAENPVEYGETAHIFILSAFVTSVLAGKSAPVDTGDGWGSNLNSLDVRKPGWSAEAVKAAEIYLKKAGVRGSLREKLGRMCHYDAVVGNVSGYFARKYGVSREAIVLAGTGDNPATLLGAGGESVVSLGSSYTVNGVMGRIIPSESGEYNVFGYAGKTAVALSCFTNGGKVHDEFLRKYAGSTGGKWEKYDRLAGGSSLSPDEPLMLAYLMDESLPRRRAGMVRDGFGPADAVTNIRALMIAQALSLKLHSAHLKAPGRMCIVGGGSASAVLRQFITDAFGVPTFSIEHSDSAAPLGCAISGARVLRKVSYARAAGDYVKARKGSTLSPIAENKAVIRKLLRRYEELEKKHAGK
jgi:xylulokinase